MDNNRNMGTQAEFLFMDLLTELKIEHSYVNSWYDFDIWYKNERIIVDVKSTRISHKCTSKRLNQSYTVGRFHFTEEQIKNKIWVALFIRFADQYIFTGMLKLNGENHKYLSIHKLREENLLSINEFKNIIRDKIK